ncbi:MAG: acyltransferase [Luteolibacter sp.]
MAARATQIDGLRAFAMLGVACVHWLPRELRGPVPFELGLFFFLVLTGYLITGVLLRERDRGEASGVAWKADGLKNFQIRRGLRILTPYYAAVALAWVLAVPGFRAAVGWYLTQLSNIHMAMTGWPDSTAHFWSLAVQHQFYVLWPFVIWWVPKRWLAPVMIAFVAVAPVARVIDTHLTDHFVLPDLLSWTACDYLGLGALMALAVHRGMPFSHPGLRRAAWICFAIYAVIYGFQEAGHPLPVLRFLQQTFLSVACCGLIAGASQGFRGWLGALLDHPAIQHLGRLSYGLYLFHNLAPRLAGWILPWLWNGHFEHGVGFVIRLAAFALISWGLAWLCWRLLEVPAQGVKARMARKA